MQNKISLRRIFIGCCLDKSHAEYPVRAALAGNRALTCVGLTRIYLTFVFIALYSFPGFALAQSLSQNPISQVLDSPFPDSPPITSDAQLPTNELSYPAGNEWPSNELDYSLDVNAGIDDSIGHTPATVWEVLVNDQRQFYSRKTLRPLIIGLSASAVLANTRMDQEFADWYQDNVRSNTSDDIAKFAKVFGEHFQMAGIFAVTSIGSRVLNVNPNIQVWSDRSLRSLLVGVPPLWLLQRSIGSSRPNDMPPSSNWDFWADDNGASGHAFVGAVPFLVASQLAERPVYKAGWIAASTLTGWSRINDNDHYLSQVVLGWCLAYASTQAIRRSDYDLGIEIRPQMIGSTPGAGISWDY